MKWVASFPSNSHTSIAINDFRSTAYQINTGIPQEITTFSILAWGKTTEQICNTLGKVVEKAQQWARNHASVIALNKFQLTHFTI